MGSSKTSQIFNLPKTPVFHTMRSFWFVSQLIGLYIVRVLSLLSGAAAGLGVWAEILFCLEWVDGWVLSALPFHMQNIHGQSPRSLAHARPSAAVHPGCLRFTYICSHALLLPSLVGGCLGLGGGAMIVRGHSPAFRAALILST